MRKLVTAIVFAVAFISPVWAAPQTVTLSVPGMTCSDCAHHVERALKTVPGVASEQPLSIAVIGTGGGDHRG